MSRFDNLFNVAKGKDVSTPPDDLSGADKLSKSKDPNYVRTTIYLPRETAPEAENPSHNRR